MGAAHSRPTLTTPYQPTHNLLVCLLSPLLHMCLHRSASGLLIRGIWPGHQPTYQPTAPPPPPLITFTLEFNACTDQPVVCRPMGAAHSRSTWPSCQPVYLPTYQHVCLTIQNFLHCLTLAPLCRSAYGPSTHGNCSPPLYLAELPILSTWRASVWGQGRCWRWPVVQRRLEGRRQCASCV